MSMASRVIISAFFEEQWTQNHPQYLSGLSRALSPTTFLLGLRNQIFNQGSFFVCVCVCGGGGVGMTSDLENCAYLWKKSRLRPCMVERQEKYLY